MKPYLNILLLTSLGLISACNHNKPGSYIDLTQHDEVSFWELVEQIEILQLKTTPESQIAEISQIIHHNDHYYILDKKSQQLFCFYANGLFKFKISAQGKGPGEYNYITHFTIDQWNNRIILLDPVVQRLLFFDLAGGHQASISIPSEKVMGFNKVWAVSDSMLLITSITYEQLNLFCLAQNKITYQDYNSDDDNVSLQAFTPYHNTYQFNGETFAIPVFSQEIVNLTKLPIQTAYKYDFGPMNNTETKIQKLREELKVRYATPDEVQSTMQALGKGKFLDQHLYFAFETHRFRLALVETGSQLKHILTDKSTHHTRVFNHFSEKISFLQLEVHSNQEDRIIIYNYDYWDRLSEMVQREQPDFRQRITAIFNPELVDEDARQIIANHNPMTDNPFLVVYKFKE